MTRQLLIFSALLIVITFSGCLRDECTSERTYVQFEPIYKTRTEMTAEVKAEPSRPLRSPGKMYVFGNFLFINEKQEGIHVFDNTVPADPKPVAFWNIPGNVDMAIRGQYLYVDQYIDLLTLDISNLQHPVVVCRAENVFPLFGYSAENGYIVDYKETTITEKIKCTDSHWGQQWFRDGDVILVSNDLTLEGEVIPGGSSNLWSSLGVAGSFARFGLVDQFLYTIDNWTLRSWALSNPACPIPSDSVWLGWEAETIFPWKDRLFVGSQNGVFIFDNTNPGHPVLESTFNHASGCDPVVCDDQYAYVTIHDGTSCNGTINQLDIIGIEALPNAALIKSYSMKRPFGLSITQDHLFLCDDGLKIFDKTNPLELVELSHLQGIDAYDVIAFSDSHLLLVGNDGFFQFDVSNPRSPRQLSLIPVVK